MPEGASIGTPIDLTNVEADLAAPNMICMTIVVEHEAVLAVHDGEHAVIAEDKLFLEVTSSEGVLQSYSFVQFKIDIDLATRSCCIDSRLLFLTAISQRCMPSVSVIV